MATDYHYNQFPPKFSLDEDIIQTVGRARTALGRYDGYISAMHNSHILLAPLFMQEAVLSSKIEGTQSTLTQVLEFAAGNAGKATEAEKSERQEIINYRDALSLAIKETKKIPLSQRILKIAHRKLMQGVRGEVKTPGEYRKVPVWIGTDKSNKNTARFIPIDVPKINDAMSQFEQYLHYSDDYDDIIKVAILHAEFESIHPFLDGNGRLGRLFIPLYLTEKKLLSSPSFYISSYFEKNRNSYYDLLLGVSKNGDWLSWCKFFVRGIEQQATENFERAQKIIDFYNKLKIKLPAMTRSQYGITALDYIFKNSYFSSTTFYNEVQIPKPTAIRLLNIFVEKGVLVRLVGKGRKPSFYTFKKLIDIADGK